MAWPYSLAIVFLGALVSFLVGWPMSRRVSDKLALPRNRLLLLRCGLALAISATLTASGVLLWYFGRPQPAPLKQTLFTGITYERDIFKSPRPIIAHIVTIDLKADGLEFLVTPGKAGEKQPLTARTTSEFAREFKLQLAINGDFFSPWFSKTPWNYYPHSGDPVTVHGIASSRGMLYTEGERKWDAPTLYLSQSNSPSLRRPVSGLYNAISGNLYLVSEGKAGPAPRPESNLPEPRTAIGFSQDESKLILILVDGRQPHFSEGMNVDELAELFVKHGAWTAINLDGGGSTTLVAEIAPGHWKILNTPAHTRIPGRERPVANHLGVWIKEKK